MEEMLVATWSYGFFYLLVFHLGKPFIYGPYEFKTLLSLINLLIPLSHPPKRV
jgi:hypothetical protein